LDFLLLQERLCRLARLIYDTGSPMPSRVFCLRAIASLVVVASLQNTAHTQAPPQSHFRLPTGFGAWNSAVADLDGDGTQELILATMDGPGGVTSLTFKTPIYILGMSGGRLVDRSAELFETQPTSWNATIMTGDFDGNGAIDFMICDRGRNYGPSQIPGDVLVDGVRGAQNEVLLNRDGKLRITEGFPRMVTSSRGCSSGDVDRSGRATIALTDWYPDKGHDPAFLLTWEGVSRFVQTRTLPVPIGQSWGVPAMADFDGNGFADVAGSQQVYWNGPGPRTGSQPLAQAAVERDGFPFWRTTLTADLTGDGLPDLVKLNSESSGVAAPGTGPDKRFAMYRGDRANGLVEKIDAFPAIATYNGNDFSLVVTALDVNFDGTLDVVSLGYSYGTLGARPPTAVWLNDGTGRFRLARWSDPIESFSSCDASEVYFLATANPKEFHIVFGGCGLGYTARTVNEAQPLTFTQ
jgi:hypothetical protein